MVPYTCSKGKKLDFGLKESLSSKVRHLRSQFRGHTLVEKLHKMSLTLSWPHFLPHSREGTRLRLSEETSTLPSEDAVESALSNFGTFCEWLASEAKMPHF